jgi:acetyltransferase-like isoleucine patch superfamily enzyme
MKALVLRVLRLAGRVWCRCHGAEVHPTALIHGFPRIVRKPGAAIRIGPGVTINASCWSNAHNDGRRTVLFAGPSALIDLRENCGLSSSRIIAYEKILIGESSLIGAGSLICDSDMHEIPLGSENPVRVSPISIGCKVFLGANTTVLKGVTIGDGAVIGASSVVTGEIPPGTIAAGNPALPKSVGRTQPDPPTSPSSAGG